MFGRMWGSHGRDKFIGGQWIMKIDWDSYTKEEEDKFNSLPFQEKLDILEKNWDDERAIELISAQLASMEKSLPEPVAATKLALKTRIPHTALSLREVLYARMFDISAIAFDQLKSGNSIAGIILTRAALETVALIGVFAIRIREYLHVESEDKLDRFLKSSLLGSKNESTKVEAINILTFIDRVDKDSPGFRKMFDDLCEMAHPNWAGTLASYGRFDSETITLHIERKAMQPPLMLGLLPLSTALDLFTEKYNESAETVDALYRWYAKKYDLQYDG